MKKEEKFRKLIELFELKKLGESIWRQAINEVNSKHNANIPEYIVDIDEWLDGLVEVGNDFFDDKEIDTLIEFLEKPLGYDLLMNRIHLFMSLNYDSLNVYIKKQMDKYFEVNSEN